MRELRVLSASRGRCVVAEAPADYHRLVELEFLIVGLKGFHRGGVLVDHLVVGLAILQVVIEFLVVILRAQVLRAHVFPDADGTVSSGRRNHGPATLLVDGADSVNRVAPGG